MGGSGGGGGKRADWAGMMIAVAAVSLVLEGSVVAAATRHVVGGSGTGWTIPPNASFYGEWSSSQTYVVGDTLVFNFPTGIHNVIQVPKSSYDACTAQNQIGSTLSTGPATVTLTPPAPIITSVASAATAPPARSWPSPLPRRPRPARAYPDGRRSHAFRRPSARIIRALRRLAGRIRALRRLAGRIRALRRLA
ncbi:cucumber peeling cupredoxin-like [Phoenix dactylifera]|uniref:Cucumber peeling cupredoxin-like n=1 Tax=Phoenix dactylifera TaxID=42345 RepID=A0A8B7BIR3_PHODC|nr:cucumber peeling cupredoxin-like [Phoenix dactylifera]